MTNTASARKAARKIVARTAVNQTERSRMRSYVRNVEEAIATGDAKKAAAALAVAEPKIMRTAQKGVIHKRAASRKISRLVARVRALDA
jgi:small subunit ribosomal protein S20